MFEMAFLGIISSIFSIKLVWHSLFNLTVVEELWAINASLKPMLSRKEVCSVNLIGKSVLYEVNSVNSAYMIIFI